eukprot:RCo015033
MDDQEDVLRDFRDPDDRAPAAASSFRDLGLRSRMLYALEKAGLERPSFVQSEAIPVAIQGKDLICQAPSGMGKTIVFVVGVLQQLETYGTVQCITLLHARELAVQVASEFERIGKHVSANVGIACCHPELALAVQKKQLAAAKPTIVVGTPGRVLGLCRSKAINCNNVKHFIIDECDAMLGSLDVRSTVQDVFRLTPITKQVMMMATTLSAEALETARKFTRNAVEITVGAESGLTLPGLLQYYLVLEEREKIPQLLRILETQPFLRCVVFCRAPATCVALASTIKQQQPSVAAFTEMEEDRVRHFRRICGPEASSVVVTTNILARGLQLQCCDLVVQYDLAETPETYLHRVGRCGRFGSKGLCIAFVSSQENVNVMKQVRTRFSADLQKYTAPVPRSAYSYIMGGGEFACCSSKLSLHVESVWAKFGAGFASLRDS